MKKVIAVTLSLLMACLMASCGNNENTDPSGDVSSSDAADTTAAIQVDEGLINVEIVLPADMYKDKTEDEIKEIAADLGIEKVEFRDDGSVVYTMTKKQHKDALEQMRAEIENSFNEVVESNTIPGFVSAEVNKDGTEIKMYMDSSLKMGMENLAAISWLPMCYYYQCFAGVEADKIDAKLSFIDNETKEEYNSITYSELIESYNEAFENAE